MAHKNPEWSANTTAYFELWKTTLHQNCKNKKKCTCHTAAYDLTVHRLGCIERGMPDLHPKEESKIWELAFDIHRNRCADLPGRRAGSISPTWSDSKELGDKVACDCFEQAMKLYTFIDEIEESTIVLEYDWEEREV
jgi:hypothetical protein